MKLVEMTFFFFCLFPVSNVNLMLMANLWGCYVSLLRKYLKVISHTEAKMAICSCVSMQGTKSVSKNVSQPD